VLVGAANDRTKHVGAECLAVEIGRRYRNLGKESNGNIERTGSQVAEWRFKLPGNESLHFQTNVRRFGLEPAHNTWQEQELPIIRGSQRETGTTCGGSEPVFLTHHGANLRQRISDRLN
jgi:hypothetical protein